jgi:DNA-directed RNA polymerase subunit RPC12/RpoP
LIHNNKKHMDKLNNMKATCPHCGIICDLGNASKHHFDNCHKVKNPELSTCPYCNFKGEYRFIKPWHFDKCKKKPGFIKNKIHKIITCPHCNKEGGIGNMKRYHFDNCKNKKEIW